MRFDPLIALAPSTDSPGNAKIIARSSPKHFEDPQIDMKRILMAMMGLWVCLSGCESAKGSRSSASVMSPVQAVIFAADAAPFGVRGTFEMDVRRVGRQDGNIYLDSESDYRDQRNLVISIGPDVARVIRSKFGWEADEMFYGKRVRVTGEARRVKIEFFANGQTTDKYYYQTHVDLREAGQIEIRPR